MSETKYKDEYAKTLTPEKKKELGCLSGIALTLWVFAAALYLYLNPDQDKANPGLTDIPPQQPTPTLILTPQEPIPTQIDNEQSKPAFEILGPIEAVPTVSSFPHLLENPEKADLQTLKRHVFDIVAIFSRYNIPSNLVDALITQESKWNIRARSYEGIQGAYGLTQIALFNVNYLSNNPEFVSLVKDYFPEYSENIEDFIKNTPEGSTLAMIYYLDEALERYNGQVIPALAEYNGGPEAGKLWNDWLKYAAEYNIPNPLDVDSLPQPHRQVFEKLRNEAVQALTKRLEDQGALDLINPETKFEEAEAYVKAITKLGRFYPYLKLSPKPTVVFYVEYTIQPGDTLSSIAERFYGDPSLFTYIAKVNRIRDPNRILAGQKISLPKRGIPTVNFEVTKEITLEEIAERFLVPPDILALVNETGKNTTFSPGEKVLVPLVPLGPN